VLTNPPYGERLSEVNALVHLYRNLGDQLRESFQGWQVGIFTGNIELAKQLRLQKVSRREGSGDLSP